MDIKAIIKSINYKKIICVVILVAWIIFSAIYIARDKWQDLQTIQMKQAYQKGVSDIVRAVITESSKCAPISLKDGDKKIDIIAVSCVSENNEK